MELPVELRDLTLRIAQAIGAGDVTFLERHTSRQPGETFIATDPDEWWTDIAGLSRTLVGQRQAGITMIPGEPLAYQEGDAGWAVDRGMRFQVGDREGAFRFSVVYRREDGEWKMVPFHSSIGVPNTEAVGVELPT
jgi:hypothetical protein